MQSIPFFWYVLAEVINLLVCYTLPHEVMEANSFSYPEDVDYN